MAHIFGPKWLRLRTPVTTDGTTLAYDDNNQVIYTEVDVPLSARTAYEKENRRLAKPYQHIIQEMSDIQAPDPTSLVKGAGLKDPKAKKNEIAESLV